MSDLDTDDIDQDEITPTAPSGGDSPAVDENSTQEHVTVETGSAF